MIELLRQRARSADPIRVGVTGAGAMGYAIAAAVRRTPGMELAWVTDLVAARAERAARHGDTRHWGTDGIAMLERLPVDVFVEASTAIVDATHVALKAVATGAHVVWMNAEADLAFGPLVDHHARLAGRVATSDAGDQHGVLARLLDEMELWGWQIVQAGNIKGFLDEQATPAGLAQEAAARRLDERACCAYTDGTKLAVEMALIGNGRGLHTPPGGMSGPRAAHVSEALEAFDLQRGLARPEVDYLLGAEPGGGVYGIGYMADPDERFMLNYYKLGPGPFYLHYRPCHLCHVETPLAIAQAALQQRALLRPRRRLNDVYAIAKHDLPAGQRLVHAIGSADIRGELRECAANSHLLPVWMAHDQPGVILKRTIAAGEPVPLDAVELVQPGLADLWERQKALF